MDNTLICVIIGVGIYTLVIGLGYIKSIKELQQRTIYTKALISVVQDIKHLLSKEEHLNMGRDSLFDGIYENNLTLSELLNNKPTEENYEEILDIVTEIAQRTYRDYKFLIAKSSDETKEPNFLQIVSKYHECPELHKKVFAKAMEYGIETRTLQKKFAERVAKGEVLNLGEDVVVITDDNTPQLPTGVSPINSGLEGGEIAFIISFLRKENYEKWKENTFPKEDEADERA